MSLLALIFLFSHNAVTTAPNASELSYESLGMEQLTPCPPTSTPAVMTTDAITATENTTSENTTSIIISVVLVGLGIFLVVTIFLVKLRAREKCQLEGNIHNTTQPVCTCISAAKCTHLSVIDDDLEENPVLKRAAEIPI